jgi:hypothetical protein
MNYQNMIFLLFFCVAEIAAGAEPYALEAGLSSTFHRLTREVSSESGNTSLMGTTYYNLRLQYHLPVTNQILFSPELDYMPATWFARKSPDGNQTSKLSYLLLPATYQLTPVVDLSGGLALVEYTIKGNGGTTVLNNGGTTSEFGLPGRTVTTRTLAWVFGSGFTYNRVRGGLNLLINAPLSNDKRTLSLALYAGYPIFGK